jgi:type I restriction enzyme S subunit
MDGANLTENADKIANIECDRDFLLYNLMSDRIQNIIESERTVGAQPKLALGKIESFRISLPPSIVEQTAIATVLSDMDAEITALEARRDKSRALKQGMMQELLTGRIRLI